MPVQKQWNKQEISFCVKDDDSLALTPSNRRLGLGF